MEGVTLHQRYIYRGYLQIACIDLTRSHHPALWYITWDPTQLVATRPLSIQKDGTWYTYGLDLTKNVCEVFGTTGYIGTTYTYSPYGQVTASGNVTQPIQWSSEFNDEELGLVYYNFRHLNTLAGRWTGRDKAGEYSNLNLYMLNFNTSDWLGLWVVTTTSDSEDLAGKSIAHLFDKFKAKDKFATLFFRWWAVGNVIKVTSNEDSISEYLSIHTSLKNTIWIKLCELLPNDLEKVALKFATELPDNGYTTGYELLHGVNMNVGGFQMNGTHRKRNGGDTCVHDFDITYTWNDIMDPNRKYSKDIGYANLVNALTDTRDYTIHISWKKSTQIIERNGVIISASGYAAPAYYFYSRRF